MTLLRKVELRQLSKGKTCGQVLLHSDFELDIETLINKTARRFGG
jgi:hypothetical protein